MFKKAIICTDQHFGRRMSSPIANRDNIDFFNWFIEEGKTFGADTVILCGDYFDSRSNINISTLEYAIKALEMLGGAFSKVIVLKGNHDIFYRTKRDVSSLTFAKHFPNIEIINNPTTFGKGKNGVTFLPWLVGDEGKLLKKIQSRYVFGHLEVSGFKMNAKIEMPETENGIKPTDFPNPEFVFSGHFHMRQQKANIVYIGNIFPFDFSDDADSDRGMMLLEWGKEPIFKSWPDQPLFRSVRLTELLNKPQAILKPKLTARVSIDVDISYEEAQVIKETFVDQYQLRRIELMHQSKSSSDHEFTDAEVVFQSVDQIVMDGLLSIESKGDMKPEMLVEIYRNLPNI